MKAHLENNRQGKHGRHRYYLEDYNLDPERIYKQLRGYMEHYDSRIDGARQQRRMSIEAG